MFPDSFGSSHHLSHFSLLFISGQVIEEYFEISQILGVKAIYIQTDILEDEDFHYNEDASNPDNELDAIDLCSFDPLIKEFKKYLGEICVFKLSMPIHGKDLSFYINEDWWIEFFKLRQEMGNRISSSNETARAKLREQQEKKNRKTLKSLNDLIADEFFTSLPTQLAMAEYAKEKIPALEEIHPSVLKIEIQTLQAKIKAKGLGGTQRR